MEKYSKINQRTITLVKELLIARRHSVAVAESVTSGGIQEAFSLTQDAMKFYQGGITAYNLGQKAKHLRVDPIEADAHNCVSENIAVVMARNVCRLFSSDWGIAVTGYDSPLPEAGVTTLYACYAISFRSKKIAKGTIYAEKLPQINVRWFYINTIMEAFLKSVMDHLPEPDLF